MKIGNGFPIFILLGEREVIEIKLTSAPAPEDLARLGQVADLLKANRQTLICRMRKSIFTGNRSVANLCDYLLRRT